jgi:hypothetical protein
MYNFGIVSNCESIMIVFNDEEINPKVMLLHRCFAKSGAEVLRMTVLW